MRLHEQGRVQTGIDMFDHSLGATTIWQDAPDGPLLVVNSGRHGGISAWRITSAGTLVLQDTVEFGNTALNAARDQLELVTFRGEMIAFFGLGETTFWGHVINPDGSFGPRRLVGFDRVEEEIEAGHDGFLRLWAMLRETAPESTPDSPAWSGTSGISRTQDGGVLLLSKFQNALHVLPPEEAPHPAGDSIGLATPTGMAVFNDAGFGTRVVIAGAAGSSLSVLREAAQGYEGADHVMDSASTALYRVQAISGATVQTANGPLDLVLAGGADHGISLFALSHEGWLIWLDTFFNTPTTGLYSVATLQSVVVGDQLIVTTTSGRDPGITVLNMPLARLGGLVYDGQGSADDNIIIARDGVTHLSGGGGANVFVIRPQQTAITITDFAPGQDRLDLSAWPMLRHTNQLEVTPLDTGARIAFRGYELNLHTLSGQSIHPARAVFVV